MTPYSPGDVLLLPFPFSDLSGRKQRPALVMAMDPDYQDLLCMMITSVVGSSAWEVPIVHWKEASLLRPSVARIPRLFTVNSIIVRRKLGTLEPGDFETIKNQLALFLQLVSVSGSGVKVGDRVDWGLQQ